MVKEYTKYICEICNRKFSDKNEAEECEARGVADASLWEPFKHVLYTQEPFYKGLIFCIEVVDIYNHTASLGLWAWRPSKRDSIATEHCSHPFDNDYAIPQDFFANKDCPDIESAEFRRAVMYLLKHGIPVRYWDGEKIVDW